MGTKVGDASASFNKTESDLRSRSVARTYPSSDTEDDNRDYSDGITLTFKHLSYTITKKTGSWICFWRRKKWRKTILDNVSGEVRPGDLIALMGASGAGKSTLLKVLSRHIRKHEGTVKINGEEADSSPLMRLDSCFIQQEDLFFGHITVGEHLEQQAAMRMAVKDDVRQARVRYVTEKFGLSKCKNSRIGNIAQGASRGISGGEKKRLSVASELLVNPHLIFADEPTSGLDAFMAESVVEVLKALADSGHSVIATIHQPSSDVFAMFNKVILISEGRVMFFGPRLAAISFFTRLGRACPPYTNPADYFVGLLAIDWADPAPKFRELERWRDIWMKEGKEFLRLWDADLQKKFEKAANETLKADADSLLPSPSKSSLDVKDDDPHFRLPVDKRGFPLVVSWWKRMWVLLHRNILNTARNPAIVRGRFIQNLLLALFGGCVFYRMDAAEWYSHGGAAFFIMVNQGFTAFFVSLTAFINDVPIVVRERDAGIYHISSFYISKILSDLMFQSVLPVVYGAVVWWMMRLGDDGIRFVLGVVTIFLLTLAVASLGYIVAAFAKNLGVGLAMGPVLLLPLLLISGFVINFESLPGFWVWLKYLSPFKYGWSGLMRAMYLDLPAWSTANECILPINPCDGNRVLESFKLSTAKWYWAIDMGCLVAWIILGRLLGLFIFMFRHRVKAQ